jgi:RNA polymerase sigma-70 factor (ECF subfamily)
MVCKKDMQAGTTISMKVPALIPDTESRSPEVPAGRHEQDRLHIVANREFGPALARLARGYEPDPNRWHDLLQTIHLEVWRSFATFDARCSLRTWVYRVAHNTALKYIVRTRNHRLATVGLDDIAELPDAKDTETQIDHERSGDRLTALISRLRPMDREVILLYLEDMSAQDISQLTGLSSAHVATKIHRIKNLLTKLFHSGVSHD